MIRSGNFILCGAFALLIFGAAGARAEGWDYKKEMLPHLVKAVPDILASQDPETGRFGKGIWIVNDQHAMLPLAAAWSIKDGANPFHGDAGVLEAIMDAGDALIEDQDEKGMWVFRKKDGSTWGDIYMPWTYSRWARTFGMIKDAMPPERRARWEKALRLGFEGIEKNEFGHIHNIPAHHAMGLYFAGKALDRPDWSTTAGAFLRSVAETQYPDGFWSENVGPVVGYNAVYGDSLGAYYGASKDPAVLPSLERMAKFHANFTYPDGSSVETVDERQVYYKSVSFPNVGVSHSAEGRGYLRRQYEKLKEENKPVSAEAAAALILYGGEGDVTPAPKLGEGRHYVQTDGKATTHREGPWFVCLSAYAAPVPPGRWILDRQNLVSLYHDKTGLILGGGNTKLQPLWSTFTAGDTSLLKHKEGEEEPDFSPRPGLVHVPDSAVLKDRDLALELDYGGAKCRLRVDVSDAKQARLVYEIDPETTGPAVEAHLPLMPEMGSEWRTASGKSGTLSSGTVTLKAGEAGDWFAHDGWKISLPKTATVTWPVLPHNQYRKDGSAEAGEGRIVVTVPLTEAARRQVLTVETE